MQPIRSKTTIVTAMGLDDLGSLAAEMRERVRSRRETFAKAEAESDAWLERLANVSREDDSQWRSTGSAPITGRPMPSANSVSPFGWLTAPGTPEQDVRLTQLEAALAEITRRNSLMAAELAELRAEVVAVRAHNDSLSNQVASLRLAQQRRYVATLVPNAFAEPVPGSRPL
jgi:hypothetical protein